MKRESYSFWTILIVVIFSATLIRHTSNFVSDIFPVYTLDNWNSWTNPSSENYSEYAEVAFIVEYCGHITILVINASVIILFFMKHKKIRLSILTYFIMTSIIAILNLYVTRLVLNESKLNMWNLQWLFRSTIFGTAIIIYTYKSKNFKSVFGLT